MMHSVSLRKNELFGEEEECGHRTTTSSDGACHSGSPGTGGYGGYSSGAGVHSQPHPRSNVALRSLHESARALSGAVRQPRSTSSSEGSQGGGTGDSSAQRRALLPELTAAARAVATPQSGPAAFAASSSTAAAAGGRGGGAGPITWRTVPVTSSGGGGAHGLEGLPSGEPSSAELRTEVSWLRQEVAQYRGLYNAMTPSASEGGARLRSEVLSVGALNSTGGAHAYGSVSGPLPGPRGTTVWR
jgi:hypothetical protein